MMNEKLASGKVIEEIIFGVFFSLTCLAFKNASAEATAAKHLELRVESDQLPSGQIHEQEPAERVRDHQSPQWRRSLRLPAAAGDLQVLQRAPQQSRHKVSTNQKGAILTCVVQCWLCCREFIQNDLLDFVKQNPGVAVYLQPKRHRLPKIEAEYRKT